MSESPPDNPQALANSTASSQSPSETNPHALETAQDDAEVFEVMHPPHGDFDMFKDHPISTGSTKARKMVHRDRDWHRSVHVWLVDCHRKLVLLQQRSPQKDTFPNRWDISAAGHMEAGSHSRETAVREVAEELGISINNDNTAQDELIFGFLCPAEQAPWGGCNAYEEVYFLERDSQECKCAIGTAEVTSVRWISFDELRTAWKENNKAFVPRVDHYKEAFFPLLDRMCSTDLDN
jgi:8-oxo-dGTP diphosphatase